jgi:predicted amidohydrolase
MRRLAFVASLLALATPAQAQPPSKADTPPRKVVVATSIYGPYGDYPGLEKRIEQLTDLVDRMAAEASRQHPGRGLDLAILPETVVTPGDGSALERARPLDGPIADAFGALARKHGCYLIVPFDMAETDDAGRPIASNAAVLFDRSGKVAGVYRKRHPVAVAGTDELERGITPGRELPVFDCDFGKLGIQICWDVQFSEDWDALGKAGAEIVAWPTASPATVLPAAHAARNRYYVVGGNWRDNATVYDPTGRPAARVEGREPAVLVHELDLSFAVLSWAPHLKNGGAFKEKYGDRAGYRYSEREDNGLFWSNDPNTPIGQMVRELNLEELDAQVARNRRLYAK